MNYLHLFHAGNFADVLKHALLLEALAALTAEPGPLSVLDTHAGAGLYDLHDPRAQRSGEAQAGVGRLMADKDPPPPLTRLKAAVRAQNPDEAWRFYPGSPRLAVGALRPGDRWTGCELRPEEAEALRRGLPHPPGVRVDVRTADGYAAAQAGARGRAFAVIDPPFERGDEADRIVDALAAWLRAPGATALVWLPLKDLDSFDRLLGRVEALDPPASLAVQARLRPLDDPMRMNGSAVLLLGLPQLADAARTTAAWVAAASGGEGGSSRVEAFGG